MRQYDFNELAMMTQGGAPAQPQKKKKNFFVDQISTVGGIAGGLFGARGGMAGAGIGSGIGSGLGEAIENALTGEAIGKNVLKEAAIGGVMGAGPLKLLKGGAALAGGKGLAGAATAAQTPLRAVAGKAVTGAADDLAIKNFRLTPTQLTNFQKKFGEDAGQVIRKYGFQNVDDIAAKGIEPLQQTFDDAVQAIPGVTKESLQKNLMKRINTLSKAGPSDTKALGGQLKKETDNLLKGYGDVIDAKELNGIRRQFDDLVNYTEKTANPARYGVNKRMADGIRETLQKADPTGQLKDVGRELQKLRQLSDVTARQGNLGRGSLPLNLPTLLGGTMGAGAGGPVGAAGMAIGTAVVNSNAGRRAAMAGAEKLGGVLTQSGAKAAASGAAKGLPLRVGLSGLASGVMNQQQPQSLEDAMMGQSLANNATNPMNTPNAMNPINAQNMGELSQTGEGMSSQDDSPFALSNVEANIEHIIASGGKTKDVAEYLDIVKTIQALQPKSESKPLTGEARNRALKAQSGLRSLDTLEETLGRDPGAFQRQTLPNPLGITGRLTGTTDVRAATDNVVDVIARMRSGAAITDSEAKRFARLLPQPGDSKESALRKLQNVRAELESYMEPDQGGGSLEDALMAYGGQNPYAYQ